MEGKASITIVENDPYVVKGGVPLSEDAIVAVPEGGHLEYNRVRGYEVETEYTFAVVVARRTSRSAMPCMCLWDSMMEAQRSRISKANAMSPSRICLRCKSDRTVGMQPIIPCQLVLGILQFLGSWRSWAERVSLGRS